MNVTKEEGFEIYKKYSGKEINCSAVLLIDNCEYFLAGFKTFNMEGEEVDLTEAQLKESYEIWYRKNRNEKRN